MVFTRSLELTPKGRHPNAHVEVFDNSSSEELQKCLVGKKISTAGRKGKQMWLEFEGDSRALLLHFGEHSWMGAATHHATNYPLQHV
jgi:formamidopyrimidine-DNA glycosylase